MTRILQGAPFQLGAVALAVTLLAAGLLLRTRDARRAEHQAAERAAAYVASLTSLSDSAAATFGDLPVRPKAPSTSAGAASMAV